MAAKKYAVHGGREYDQQLIMRLAIDQSSISFVKIDYELLLLSMGPSLVVEKSIGKNNSFKFSITITSSAITPHANFNIIV